jgi:hypothetical protein
LSSSPDRRSPPTYPTYPTHATTNARTAEEPSNMKALYRRGQAHLELSQLEEAVSDLEGALRLAGSDPAQQQPIREKLEAAKGKLAAAPEKLAAESDAAPAEAAAADGAAPKAAAGAGEGADEDGKVDDEEEVEEIVNPAAVREEQLRKEREAREKAARERAAAARTAAAAAAAAPAAAAGFGGMPMGGGMPGGDDMAKMAAVSFAAARVQGSGKHKRPAAPPPQANQTPTQPPKTQPPSPMQHSTPPPQMMADNPDMMRMAADMMSSLPADQIAAMTAAQPGMTPEMARMAAEQVKKMSPADMRRMGEMAAAMQGGGGGGGAMQGAAGAAAASAGDARPGGMPMGIDPASMDPGMMSAAAEMIDKMSPEDLKAMMQAAGAANGMAVPDVDPGMLKASMGMLKNMVRGGVGVGVHAWGLSGNSSAVCSPKSNTSQHPPHRSSNPNPAVPRRPRPDAAHGSEHGRRWRAPLILLLIRRRRACRDHRRGRRRRRRGGRAAGWLRSCHARCHDGRRARGVGGGTRGRRAGRHG